MLGNSSTHTAWGPLPMLLGCKFPETGASYDKLLLLTMLGANVVKHSLCLRWETRTGLLSREGALAFELQQIIQGLFQLLDMNLRLIQYLPLRTQTQLRRQPVSAAGTIFLSGPRKPLPCKVPPLALSVQRREGLSRCTEGMKMRSYSRIPQSLETSHG